MRQDQDPNDKQVGYGRPPVESQFRKGVSGNPRGRPKGSKNLSTIVTEVGKQMVRINTQNGSRKISKLEAMVLQLSNQAIQGNLPAVRSYFALTQATEQNYPVNSPTDVEPNEANGAVHLALLKRLKRRLLQADDGTADVPEGARSDG